MLEIYYWLTDNGRKALQAIEETGLPHRKVPVDLTKREQFSSEFLKISPGHKIPALVDEDGPGGARVTLCESGAILKYLAEKAGGALYPTAPVSRAKVDPWFFYATATFTPLAQQYGFFMHRSKEDVPAAKQHFAELLRDIFAVFDKQLATSQYLAGDYSIADIAAFPDVHLHGKLGLGIDAYPNLGRWHDAIAARPAVQRAWAVNS